MLHSPKSDKSSSSTESSLAVDSNSSVIWLLEMLLNNIEEVSHNLVWGSRSINEEEVIMGDSSILEVLFVVLLLVESDDSRYIYVLKDICILIWVVTISLALVSVLNWSHESYELSWDNPVEVTVLNSFVVLILLDIECPEVVPAESDSILETLEAVQESAVVEAVTL